MELPLWINEELFRQSLSSYLNETHLKILEFSHKLAITTGENYTTYVFRINVTFVRNQNAKEQTKEKRLLILKCNREGLMEALVAEMNLFRKEVDMFRNILPKMNDICGGKFTLTPKGIYASLTPHQCLMIEDLRPLGFKVHERRAGLNLQHTLKVLEKLANFHAVSVVMIKKYPSILHHMYTEGLFSNIDSITTWMKLGFQMLSELTANCEELEIYHEKFKRNTDPVIIERARNSWYRESGQFSVLNHGDLWVNNIMFSYEANGAIKDCKLIDFQLCIYTSPAIDLHYFLSTSLADDVIKETDYLLDYYYAYLIVTLVKLRYNLQNVPTLKEFRDDYRKRSFYGLLTIATATALFRAEHREDANFEDLMTKSGENSFRHHCYTNDIYKSIISRSLPIYDNYGVFL